jgi:CHAT domain-containing protein/tetratricopeptide (TPR) repeat protein
MPRITLILLSLFLLPALGRADEQVDAWSFVPGQSHSVLLTPEHSARLSLDLAGLEAASIIIDAAVPEIDYKLMTPDGSEIFSGRLAASGWTVIPFAVDGLRQAHLQLSAKNGIEDLPGVRVRIELRAIPVVSISAQTRAAGLFVSAQTLHRSLHAEDLRRAIDVFQQASDEWRVCGDRYAMALALDGKAESQMALSRDAEALGTLAQASKLADDHIYLRGMLLHDTANIYLDRWQGEKASAPAKQELRLARQIQDDGLAALAAADLTAVSFWIDPLNANHAAEQAHTEATAAGLPEALGLEGKWMGWIDESAENKLGALRALSQSESFFRRAGDLRAAMQGEVELASAITLDGDHYSALLKFQELEQVTGKMGNRDLHGLVLGNIGDTYRQLGRPQLADIYYRKAVAIFTATGFNRGRAQNLIDLCETALDVSTAGSAIGQCRAALNSARQSGYPGYIGEALCDFGIAERKLVGDGVAFATINSAVAESSKVEDLREEATEHLQLGEILERAGKGEAALKEFESAAQLSESVTNPANLVETYYAVAQWYLQAGQYEMAGKELNSALEKVESARNSVGSSALQASWFAAERKFYELGIELSMRQFQAKHEKDWNWRALELSEQSHARSLLDELNAQSAETTDGHSNPGRVRSQSVISLNRAFDRRLKLLVEGGDARDFNRSNTEMSEAIVEAEQAEEKSRRTAGASPRAPTITREAVIQANRDSGTAYFEYELEEDRSYLWVVYGGNIDAFPLPARHQLDREIDEWRFLAAGTGRSAPHAGQKLRRISARLSCDLFAGAVKPGMTRILIVPDGSLAMVPFEALPESGCSRASGEPLIVEHEVIEVPSLSVFYLRKQQIEKTSYLGQLAIVADPVFDADDSRLTGSALFSQTRMKHSAAWQSVAPLSRLVNTGDEASAIEDIVRKSSGTGQVAVARGLDANLDAVLDPAMRNYRIWHLATHGFYDQSMPEFSGLVFSQIAPDGSPRSGFLNAHDIAGLDVHAELVVLNACDSAAGENISGEGVMGLSYAFLRAGARQIISALWSIDDARSKDLMIAFYSELMHNGGDAAAALRKAQLTLMRQPNASAPYYWAGFELTAVGQ